MPDPLGFLKIGRAMTGDPHRDPAERVKDYHEVFTLLPVPQVREQAQRCMACGVPFCHNGCPLGNLIPEWNDLVYQDRWREAYERLDYTNNFPEFTGFTCPAPCEAACVLEINDDPVMIKQIELSIIERAFEEGWVVPRPPARRTGQTVAVVGSGPAGLAAAAQLNARGHTVTVIERADEPGGLLRFGIPDFKLEKHVIDRRVRVLEAEGIVFRTGVDVGASPGWDTVFDEHDALVLAIGARRARTLDVPGRELHGVVQAMDFLEAQNRAVHGGYESVMSARGKRVIILGGGDTGSDCLGTVLRQGARSVTQAELMPAPGQARAANNPWPQWPLVFRVSSSQEEGGARLFAKRTVRLEGDERGQLCALHWNDERVEVDLVIQAMGFLGPETEALAAQLGVELDARGNVKGDAQLQTSVPGVFVGGDAYRGASLVVWAISDGRELARHVDAFLTGRPSRLPAKGREQPFGGR